MGWRIPVAVADLVIIKGSGTVNGIIFDLDGAVFDGAVTMTSPIGGPSGVPGILMTSPSDFNSAANDSQAAFSLVGESADGSKGPFIWFGSNQFPSSNIEPVQAITVGSHGFSSGGVPGGNLTVNVMEFLAPSGDTSGAKDAARINALIAAGCKLIFLLPGTFYLNATMALGVGQYIAGAGFNCTTVNWVGTGDCFRQSASVGSFLIGGGISGLTVDGSSAGAGSNGLHVGDIAQLRYDVMVQHFNGAGSAGVLFDNTFAFTEQAKARIFVNDCSTGVGFNVSGAVTSTNSYARGEFDIFINMNNGQNAVTFTNGALLYDGTLAIRGNVHGSGTAAAILTVTGTVPAGHPGAGGFSAVRQCRLDMGVEQSGTGFQPISIGSTSNNVVNNCYGVLDFSVGTAMTASNPGDRSFIYNGTVLGDTSLVSTTRYGSTTQNITANGQTIFLGDGSGSVRRLTSTGAFTALALETGFDGQPLWLINESGNALTFDVAANSHVADGVSSVIQPLTAMQLIWDTNTSLWYQVRQ